MEVEDAKNRTTKEVGERKNIRNAKNRAGGLGIVQPTSREPGIDSISTCREDRNEGNTSISGNLTPGAVVGKIASQLVEEAEKELAYHEKQAETLKDRIKTLKTISEFAES